MIRVTMDDAPHRWVATDGAGDAGRLAALIRPDQRCVLRFADCRPDAYRPLVEAATAALHHDLYVVLDAGDQPTRALLADAGFVVNRYEHHYLVPTDPTRVRLPDTDPPDGFDLISAADADLAMLQELDETLREDIPGSDGWRWTPDDFAEETFSFGFDPATYLVAVQRDTGAYAGLMRVWIKPDGPKFGTIGVRRQWRRTRLTVALGAAVFRVLHERGMAEVWCDIDPANRGSTMLARRLDARQLATEVELRRPRC